MAEDVRPFPVREREGRHEVLVIPEDKWLRCETPDDARAVSRAPVLEYESLNGTRAGGEFAAELEETANALDKYRIGLGARFFRRRAEEVRMNG